MRQKRVSIAIFAHFNKKRSVTARTCVLRFKSICLFCNYESVLFLCRRIIRIRHAVIKFGVLIVSFCFFRRVEVVYANIRHLKFLLVLRAHFYFDWRLRMLSFFGRDRTVSFFFFSHSYVKSRLNFDSFSLVRKLLLLRNVYLCYLENFLNPWIYNFNLPSRKIKRSLRSRLRRFILVFPKRSLKRWSVFLPRSFITFERKLGSNLRFLSFYTQLTLV